LQSAQVAESLHTLLNNADIQGPYVMVGHSLGGFHVRSFAHQYPEKVAGIVLVDAYHENELFRLPVEFAQVSRDGAAGLVSTLKLVHALAPFGVIRAFGLAASFAQGDIVGNSLAPQDYAMLVAFYNRTHFSRAVRYENEIAILDVGQTRPVYTLGDIPLIALTKPAEELDVLPPGITEDVLAQANETKMDLQEELAALSTNGKLVVVNDTGHYIQIDQPDAVIEAVNTLVTSLQDK
jgi:pimeloyl-ACP methyl ester carboxylesterase